MAKYRLVAPAIIDDVRREPGFEFEWDGVPGHHMEPLDTAAKKAVEDRDKASEDRQPIGSPLGAATHVEPPPLTPPPPPQDTLKEEEDKRAKEAKEAKEREEAKEKEEAARRGHDTTTGGVPRRG